MLVTQLCLTLCNPMNCSPPGSSLRGISQVRIPEWVATSFSGGSSWPRNWTHISWTGRRILYHWATWEALSSPSDRLKPRGIMGSCPFGSKCDFCNRQPLLQSQCWLPTEASSGLHPSPRLPWPVSFPHTCPFTGVRAKLGLHPASFPGIPTTDTAMLSR